MLLSIAIIVPMPLLFKPVKDCLHLIIFPQSPDEGWIHYPLSVALQTVNLVGCSAAVMYSVGMDSMLTYVSGSTSP